MSSKATIRDATFSALPCPYGCCSSGGLCAILTANKITMEQTISEVEWRATASKALEPDMTPPIALMIASNVLTIIPIHVARMIVFVSCFNIVHHLFELFLY